VAPTCCCKPAYRSGRTICGTPSADGFQHEHGEAKVTKGRGIKIQPPVCSTLHLLGVPALEPVYGNILSGCGFR